MVLGLPIFLYRVSCSIIPSCLLTPLSAHWIFCRVAARTCFCRRSVPRRGFSVSISPALSVSRRAQHESLALVRLRHSCCRVEAGGFLCPPICLSFLRIILLSPLLSASALWIWSRPCYWGGYGGYLRETSAALPDVRPQAIVRPAYSYYLTSLH